MTTETKAPELKSLTLLVGLKSFVWDNTPNMRSVPVVDPEGGALEIVLVDGAKDFYDANILDQIETLGSEFTDKRDRTEVRLSVAVEGPMNKRFWKRRDGGFGYTWQVIVQSISFTNGDGETVSFQADSVLEIPARKDKAA
jgi:hypothetical protein